MGLSLQVFGKHVHLNVEDPALLELLLGNFGAMMRPQSPAAPDLEYTMVRAGRGFSVESAGHTHRAANRYELVYAIEKEITVELQKLRGDLFFVHSAVVEWQGKATLLAADSGCGKSTTTWALLHHGFGYLSDELAAIDLATLRVHPYPHAICLKRPPPAPYVLPQAKIDLGRTIHVPVQALPAAAVDSPLDLGTIVFVKYSPDLDQPMLKPVSQAESAARLYAHALNALAHRDRGLDSVVRIAGNVPCFELLTGDLRESCELVRRAAEWQSAR